MSRRGEVTVAVLVGVVVAALLVCSTATMIQVQRVLHNRSSPTQTCAGSLWTDLADRLADDVLTLPLVDSQERRITGWVAVPEYRVRACIAATWPVAVTNIRQDFRAELGSARSEASMAFYEELERYLTDRFGALTAVVTLFRDMWATGTAGIGSAVDELLDSGNPLAALVEGGASAWNTSGRKYDERERARRARLVQRPEAILRAMLEHWFDEGRAHDRHVESWLQEAMTAASRQEITGFAVMTVSVEAPSTADPPLYVVQSSSEWPALPRTVVALAIDEAASAAGEAILAPVFRSGRLSRAGRVTVGAALWLGTTIAVEVLMIKIEEWLYRDTISRELRETYQRTVAEWAEAVEASYVQQLAEREEDLGEDVITALREHRILLVVR